MILGVLPTTVSYLSETVKLESGDVIVLFTDGITEAMNIHDEEFTDERFEELVLNCYDQSPEQILNNIKLSIKEFTAEAEQSDDITCLILKVK